MQDQLADAAEFLTNAHSVACLTGAGVSAESGVATFRDSQTGLWSKFDPAKLASQQGFAKDPARVWSWYMDRLDRMSSVPPNPGHIALAELEHLVPVFNLFTQNVDDLHERGGCRSVHHLHGSISRYRCNRCRAPYELSPEDRSADSPPVCPHCGGLVRPDVVWFGEMLPGDVLTRAQRAAGECDVMLVVGTSGIVYPAAGLPYIAQEHEAAIVEVNPEETEITHIADVVLRGPSGEVLPKLIDQMSPGPK